MSPSEASGGNAPDTVASFEAALARLETLVGQLESGDVPLEQSLQTFEEAQRLIAFCEQKLQAAEKALKLLGKDADSALGPADATRT
jgi:exodeoxyribonuclease VII small subunit